MIVANRRGLITSLLRERLKGDKLDILIEFVPEGMLDADIILTTLQEKHLSIVSKLCIADATLRMAIASDTYSEEKDLKIVFASLTVVINCFYLTQGPVGVAADVLYEDLETNISQICRNSVYRMISSMETIPKGRESVKKECAVALEKLAGLCKATDSGDGKRMNTGIQSIRESISKAAEALGNRF